METFNILGKAISFDEDFSKYSNIQKKKLDYCKNFSNKFNNFVSSQRINSMDEFITHISYVTDFMSEEFSSISNEILNILAQYNIFDKSTNDIIANCITKNDFAKYIDSYMHYIENFIAQLKQKREEISFSAERTANKIYQPDYIGVITSSAWVSVTTDMMNEKEEYRTIRKRENFVNRELKKADKEILEIANKNATQNIQEFQEKVFNYGMLAICEMFEYCINILISENKISSNITKYFQNEKAINILNNLERAQNENIKKEQLIIAFEADPFSGEIHSKLIDYISDDLEEYVRFIKFIQYENIILEICQNKCSNLQDTNNKYVKIMNALDKNYVSNIIVKANTIEDVEDTNPNINLSISKKIFNMDFNKTFDTFLYASYQIGKVQEQNKNKRLYHSKMFNEFISNAKYNNN